MDWLVDCCACFLIVELLAEFDRDTGAALGPGEKLCGSKGGWLLGGARVELRRGKIHARRKHDKHQIMVPQRCGYHEVDGWGSPENIV